MSQITKVPLIKLTRKPIYSVMEKIVTVNDEVVFQTPRQSEADDAVRLIAKAFAAHGIQALTIYENDSTHEKSGHEESIAFSNAYRTNILGE